MIKVENLLFKWTDKAIFDGVSFVVNNEEKIGLVGINGAGKTTLFKIISGFFIISLATTKFRIKEIIKPKIIIKRYFDSKLFRLKNESEINEKNPGRTKY